VRRVRIILDLIVDGSDVQDAYRVVDCVLAGGTFQDLINGYAICAQKDVRVTSLTLRGYVNGRRTLRRRRRGRAGPG